jgi:hypothetical protein
MKRYCTEDGTNITYDSSCLIVVEKRPVPAVMLYNKYSNQEKSIDNTQ